MDNVLITAGIACMIAAIVGGGLKAFGNEFPLLASVRRQALLGGLGVALFALGRWDLAPVIPAERANSAPSNEAAEQDGPAIRQQASESTRPRGEACYSTDDLTANRRRIIVWARNPARSLEQLQGLAGLMGLSADGDLAALSRGIHRAVFENYCSNAALGILIARVEQQSWGSGL